MDSLNFHGYKILVQHENEFILTLRITYIHNSFYSSLNFICSCIFLLLRTIFSRCIFLIYVSIWHWILFAVAYDVLLLLRNIYSRSLKVRYKWCRQCFCVHNVELRGKMCMIQNSGWWIKYWRWRLKDCATLKCFFFFRKCRGRIQICKKWNKSNCAFST